MFPVKISYNNNYNRAVRWKKMEFYANSSLRFLQIFFSANKTTVITISFILLFCLPAWNNALKVLVLMCRQDNNWHSSFTLSFFPSIDTIFSSCFSSYYRLNNPPSKGGMQQSPMNTKINGWNQMKWFFYNFVILFSSKRYFIIIIVLLLLWLFCYFRNMI